METKEQHHFTFAVEELISTVPPVAYGIRKVGVIADSHAEALNVVVRHFPTARRVYLSSIEPGARLCADERCAVCYPSKRNGG